MQRSDFPKFSLYEESLSGNQSDNHSTKFRCYVLTPTRITAGELSTVFDILLKSQHKDLANLDKHNPYVWMIMKHCYLALSRPLFIYLFIFIFYVNTTVKDLHQSITASEQGAKSSIKT